ncbi:MAG: ketose-bisphosphate aldolase [Planctomycetes bacterium]|nr:ketose-bisphosphate aldolase [Planctomycetota bacterium]
MPVATPKQYAAMLDAAQEGSYAYAAMNVSSLVTANAALKAFSDKRSDGIIQISTGAGKFVSGLAVGDAVLGAIVLAEAVHKLAERHDVLIGLHTDHCQPGFRDGFMKNWLAKECERLGFETGADGDDVPAAVLQAHPWLESFREETEKGSGRFRRKKSGDVDGFLRPLIQETARRREAGRPNLFQSHMLDASNLPLDLNLQLSRELLALCAQNEIVLEVEAGVVGGEEDGIDHTGAPADKLYTTPEDMVAVYEALHGVGRYMFAATFGNVHGHYKPGVVKLRPEILKAGQQAVLKNFGAEAESDLVFHGGSGTPTEQIAETLDYGVVKMNIDTDTQYAFTRPIVDHVLKNYESVLKVDGEMGDKKHYDPRSYLKKAETGAANRLAQACDDLRSTGKTICGRV